TYFSIITFSVFSFFPIQVAVYTRQELNIRITANFLLALAANLPLTKSHVRRYFCTAVQLPSDWLEVVRIYSTVSLSEFPLHSLPMCLKKAMADKFKEFSEYQLAKYNTRKMRCKHACKKNKGKVLFSALTFLQIEDSKVRVDKKQSEFSIKKMIKRLHIKEPAEHVMAILGKKYPADQTAFTDSGIKGNWDRKRAGQRMKLKEPETWERLLSLEGNKAATWEKLIDNKSLPFMAMLRNLRNMIIMGISEAHHKKILGRLTDKVITQSRQFPFRFLAAYKVIMELHSLGEMHQVALVYFILQGILKRMPKSHRFKRQHWETATRSRMRVTLGVPSIYRLYRMKKNQLLKANHRLYSVDLLDRYRKALETAVQISCRYNVPPLPGRTVILLVLSCVLPMSFFVLSLVLCLVLSYALSYVLSLVLSYVISCLMSCILYNALYYVLFLVLSYVMPCLLSCVMPCLMLYLALCLVLCLVLSYVLALSYVLPYIFSLVLCLISSHRFVAERGSSRLLDHVEHLDKLYSIPPPVGLMTYCSECFISSLVHCSVLRWRGVRVFISSTFRDMHSERDVLVRSVFPELRRRAAQHRLHLQEVELRWGVTEEESERAAQLCLSEVCRSQMLVGILGERYGMAPPKPDLPDLPHSKPANVLLLQRSKRHQVCVLNLFVKLMSIKGLVGYGKGVVDPGFCCSRSVPVAWRSHFAAESKNAESKMASLKKRLLDSDVKSCFCLSYSCEWGGLVEGKPHLKKLEDFGKFVLEDLWMAVTNILIDTSQHLVFYPPSGRRATRPRLHRRCLSRRFTKRRYGGSSLVGHSCCLVPDLLSEFHSTLSDVKKDKPLALLVDGVDLVRDGRGQLNSDWIPQQLPQGVCLVMSITSKAALLQTLAKKTGTVLFTLTQLTMLDRREMVQKKLDASGKRLSDSAFNNQVLLNAFSSFASPLYLHLACEDLKNFASFDKEISCCISSVGSVILRRKLHMTFNSTKEADSIEMLTI
uniref:TROVE domain-containing protein n=1 Tax=Amphiprion ocellaris TaxID=80972 RepID=A0A3Q1AT66_AMPOC